MDKIMLVTVIGTGASVFGLIYMVIRNFKKDFHEKFELLENRIFHLAMGRSFQSILREEKRHRKGNK